MKFLDVVEATLVAEPHVLLLELSEERVVRLRRLPPVDHEVALGLLDVTQQLGADVADPATEELRPVPVGSVDACELLRVANLVAKDERDQRRPPSS